MIPRMEGSYEEILGRIKERIIEEGGRYDLSRWVAPDYKRLPPEHGLYRYEPENLCGTAFCHAGWVAHMDAEAGLVDWWVELKPYYNVGFRVSFEGEKINIQRYVTERLGFNAYQAQVFMFEGYWTPRARFAYRYRGPLTFRKSLDVIFEELFLLVEYLDGDSRDEKVIERWDKYRRWQKYYAHSEQGVNDFLSSITPPPLPVLA